MLKRMGEAQNRAIRNIPVWNANLALKFNSEFLTKRNFLRLTHNDQHSVQNRL